MSKSISYRDFLLEGTLKAEPVSVVSTPEEHAEKPIRIVPNDAGSVADAKAFWKRLRHFYRTGQSPEGEHGLLMPALLAPFLKRGQWETEYPFYLADEVHTSQPLESLIITTLSQRFKEHEAKVLKRFLPRLLTGFRLSLSEHGGSATIGACLDQAFESMHGLEVHDDEGVRFQQDLETLRSALPQEGFLLDFHPEVPLLLLRQKLEQIRSQRNVFKQKIKAKKEALQELLLLENEKVSTESLKLGFAENMIALEKVSALMPEPANELLSKERRERLENLVSILEATLQNQEHQSHIVVAGQIKDRYPWETIFQSSRISYKELNTAFDKAREAFELNMTAFASVFVAMRKAELELEGKYEAAVHDDFFDHFKWFKLEEEELALFPPVILAISGPDLIEDALVPYAALLSANKPIKVLALTDRTATQPMVNVDWEDASFQVRPELVAYSLAQRNAFTLQCASDQPRVLLEGLRSGVSSIAPAILHILVPGFGEDPAMSFLKVNAAAEGRYFPFLEYNPRCGKSWGGRFQISENPAIDAPWPVHTLSYQAADGSAQTMQLAFTYADYKALTPEKVAELFLVPEALANDYFIPLAVFLTLPQNEQMGKVPFIWLVDEDSRLIRAAVPYMWVASALERLDFWQFLQELGGQNSYHVNEQLAKAKNAWQKEREAETAALQEAHARELEKVSKTAASQALDKLAGVLLNLDDITPSPPPKTSPPKVVPEELVSEASAPPANVTENENAAPASDPWVESFRCTSCNDCTEKFPSIFGYNEDKQAQVKEGYQGTFEQLVLAAENCPASCIHPGSPKNDLEPNLAELKLRAEKFN